MSAAPTTVAQAGKVARADVACNDTRGGDLRILLSPRTVGTGTGFMGSVVLAPGDVVTEHWHPYSDEHVYVTAGEVSATLDGVELTVGADEALFVPRGTRHRFVNRGTEDARAVFWSGPLAPRPDLGHVDTEPLPSAATAPGHPEV